MFEEGRFRNSERCMRLCQFCNMNMIEDEFHFVLVCLAFRDLRRDILHKYYCTWPTTTKFVKLLTSSSTITLQRLAKFVYLAFDHTKALL